MKKSKAIFILEEKLKKVRDWKTDPYEEYEAYEKNAQEDIILDLLKEFSEEKDDE